MTFDRIDPADLERLGRAAYGGDDPHPPGVAGLPPGALDAYAFTARDERDALRALVRAADAGGPWALVGAFCVASRFGSDTSPVALDLVDRATLLLRDEGVSYPSVPQAALRRWADVHGSEGLGPVDWPSALENRIVCERGAEPRVAALERGESRRLAQLRADAASNVIFAEWSPDGRAVVAIIDGVDTADGVRRRRRWEGVEADGYVAFLRELGDRLVTPTHWAHPDLAPYFPCRARTRGAMRDEARRLRAAA